MKSIPQSEPYYGRRERRAINRYLKSGAWLTEHTKTKELEEEIAYLSDAKYCSVVPSGTAGLVVALMALDIMGDVIVPDLTMIASYNAVLLAGGEPVLADIHPLTLCIDPDKIKINSYTTALMVVHFNGRSPDMKKIKAICKEEDLHLIEDSCQAFPKKLEGDIGVYSFSPHKIITMGQGGAVVTNKKYIYEKVERLKDFGRLEGGHDNYRDFGGNFKFTDLQAVFGLEQLKTLDWRIHKKKQIYAWYKGIWPDFIPWFIPHYSPNRKKIMAKLKEKGIGTRAFYPSIGDFPVAKKVSKHGFWLPSSLSLTKSQVDHIKSILEE